MRIPFLPADLHTTERPSSTAQWTTLGRAFELQRPPGHRIVTDEYAPLFLSATSRGLLAPLRLGSPLVRVAERHPLAGVSAFALCRHRFIDEHLGAALADPHTAQVLILGAGYDSRAYRFADELAGRRVFEVDLAPLSRRKAAIVAAQPARFAGNRVERVEINFRADSLAERLAASAFVSGAQTFVVWEGVSMYLSSVAVADTLDTLGEICGPGSTLAVDFWHRLPGLGPRTQVRRLGARAIALIGEPVTFGVAPADVSGLLAVHGFDVLDLVRSRELAARYSTGGRPCEESVYVLAARR
ncbi:MAG: SAM-dependent methyltransferase [Pseudonocardiales bacterium]